MSENSNTENLLAKIKQLKDDAVATYHTKKTAKPFVEQLKSIEYQLPENPALRYLFCEFVCYVSEASGQGRDKQHWLSSVAQYYNRFENDLKIAINK